MLLALTLLTGGALLTLVLGVLGGGDPVAVLPLGVAYALLATLGFRWVQRRDRRWWSGAYVLVGLVLASIVFALAPGVGATLFLVVLVSQCVLLLPLPVTAVVIAMVPMVHAGMPLIEGVREGLGTLVAVVFAAVVTELLRREQAMRRELATAHQQLRDRTAEVERLAAAQERNRLARDIHDGLGHSLTVVAMQLQAARALLAHGSDEHGPVDGVLAKAQHQSQSALAEVRRSVRVLREPRVVPPLPEVLRDLAAESSAAGLPTALTVVGDERPVSETVHEALFRTAQEGLTNVRKHAAASRAELVLDYAAAAVRVEVRDDGRGAGTPDPDDTGVGLLGLRERAEDLGGRLELAAAPGGGCALTVEVPA
ncbi:sensor histidine kinase [Actinomycetospora cinnamomea]|uniref:Oxygen sensor histidine kinase NreB n=1 Tax=Actinomycetospora cinnamomea TaxID=663609 RepID=A0A2U1F8Y8_9PSEU|nr:sensor histidine kinase [Actinomycetospora cinnamomea]PVZ08634.1 signal transduction histidine kinase [Actinomycetospora cinnamomea]